MNHFDYRDGVLCAEDVPLPRDRRAVGTPFYCYSTATLTRHFNVFSKAFSGLDALVCYAMKANSNQAVIKLLGNLGAGADVVSEGELRRALAAGIAPARIMFSGVGKTAREMDFALAAGIHCFNVESEPELEAAVGARRRRRRHRADLGAHQSRRRRQDPSQDRHRQGREQVRRPLAARPPGLRQGGRAARHPRRRHRHPYRQPDHRAAAVRRRLRAARRPGRRSCAPTAMPSSMSISAAGSASPTAPTTSRRRCPTPMRRSCASTSPGSGSR